MRWNFQYRLEIWFLFDIESDYIFTDILLIKISGFWTLFNKCLALFSPSISAELSAWGYIKPKTPGLLNNRISLVSDNICSIFTQKRQEALRAFLSISLHFYVCFLANCISLTFIVTNCRDVRDLTFSDNAFWHNVKWVFFNPIIFY